MVCLWWWLFFWCMCNLFINNRWTHRQTDRKMFNQSSCILRIHYSFKCLTRPFFVCKDFFLPISYLIYGMCVLRFVCYFFYFLDFLSLGRCLNRWFYDLCVKLGRHKSIEIFGGQIEYNDNNDDNFPNLNHPGYRHSNKIASHDISSDRSTHTQRTIKSIEIWIVLFSHQFDLIHTFRFISLSLPFAEFTIRVSIVNHTICDTFLSLSCVNWPAYGCIA